MFFFLLHLILNCEIRFDIYGSRHTSKYIMSISCFFMYRLSFRALLLQLPGYSWTVYHSKSSCDVVMETVDSVGNTIKHMAQKRCYYTPYLGAFCCQMSAHFKVLAICYLWGACLILQSICYIQPNVTGELISSQFPLRPGETFTEILGIQVILTRL